MLKNFLKTSIRNFRRSKLYSLVNVLGLTIGFASCLVIISFIKEELSYDRVHHDAEQVYRVGYEVSLGTGSKVIASSPHRLAPALEVDFPRLEEVIHFSRIFENEVKYKDKKFLESKIAFVDSAFLTFFDFKMISGDPEYALLPPNQVVISQSAAKRFFGEKDPVGEEIEIGEPYGSGDIPLTVAGVIEDMPSNSHFHMDFLISMGTGKEFFPDNLYKFWGWDSHYTYVRLPETMESAQFSNELLEFGNRHIDGKWFIKFFAQPMVDIHLKSHLNSEIEANSDEIYIYIFSIVGLIILVLAVVNYMNLATARAATRRKEIGIRKVVGAQRRQIIIQFLGESLLYTLSAFLLAVAVTMALEQPLENFTGKNLLAVFWEDNLLVTGFVLLVILTGFIAGSYPAFYLSLFRPSAMLKGSLPSGRQGTHGMLRKGLVTFQFALSTALIIGSIIVYNQLNYLRSKKLGAETDRVVLLNLTNELSQQYPAFKQNLLTYSGIENVTTSTRRIGRDINNGSFYGVENEGAIAEARLSNIWVDYDFLETFDIELIAGRNFSREYISDTSGAVLLNESAVKALDFQDPEKLLGRKMKAWEGFNPRIVGIVRDFHFEQLYNEIKPMIFLLYNGGGLGWASIKLNRNADIGAALNHVGNAWNKMEPKRDFRYTFLNDDLYQLYKAEENFLVVFTLFTGIAIAISCLGIFALASFSAAQRYREMGIRKVLGASVADLSMLLTTDFLKWVVISNIIAWPAAYLAMNIWLRDFPYSTDITIGAFIIASLVAVLFSLVTVSFQSLKAATANPADVLKDE